MPIRVAHTARLVAVTLVVSFLVTGCSFASLPIKVLETPAKPGYVKESVTVQAMYASGATGGVSEQKISVKPSDDGSTTIDFSEDEVSGFGEMTRAASWNAVTVATLLTGAPLEQNFRFAFKGRIDGPSAGALTTAALLSLYFGDTIDEKATMTGTINPTGTVGSVGGIPQKVQGVIDDKKITKVLIPAGQRNAKNHAGELVDVVKLGADKGVTVIEVGDIYQAYKELTGQELPTPSANRLKVDTTGYDKLKSAATSTLARYKKAEADFAGLNPVVQQAGADVRAYAAGFAARANDLQRQGLQGGAFVEAHRAAMVMEAVTRSFSTIQSLLVTGAEALEASLAASATVNEDFVAFVDKLSAYTPKTLTDVEALVSAYGNAFDSFSLLNDAQARVEHFVAKYKRGEYSDAGQFVQDAMAPMLYFQLAQGQLEFAKSVFDVGRDNSGAPVASDVDLTKVSGFFRKGADANWQAFRTGIIDQHAKANGESTDLFAARLAAVDLDIALAMSAQSQLPALQRYIGSDKPNAAYAAMGYGYLNYSRNANLIEKYYNNGILDNGLNIVGVNSDTVLTNALDLGRAQVERSANILSKHDTIPVLAIGAYEQAGVDREGTVADKFTAISQYSNAFMLNRIMTFVGGFPREGYER